jgi:hypothetical protein
VQWQRSPLAEGDLARDYLVQRYAEMGLGAEVRPQGELGFPAPAGTVCENVVAAVPGRDPLAWVVVEGHYDAVLMNGGDGRAETVEGAYDNGVGTAAVFELARLFAQYHHGTLEATMAFVHTDCEEWGEVGAYGFVAGLPEGVRVVGAINLDMVGLNWPVLDNLPPAEQPYYNLYAYTAPLEDFTAYDAAVEANASRFGALRQAAERAVVQLGLPPKYVWVLDDVEGNSDQRPFVEAGIPAMWLRGMHHGLVFNRGSGSPEDLEKGLDEMNHKHTVLDTKAWLEQMAGGRAGLLAGIQTPLDLAYRVALDLASPALAQPLAAQRATPAPGVAILALAMAALALARRR